MVIMGDTYVIYMYIEFAMITHEMQVKFQMPPYCTWFWQDYVIFLLCSITIFMSNSQCSYLKRRVLKNE